MLGTKHLGKVFAPEMGHSSILLPSSGFRAGPIEAGIYVARLIKCWFESTHVASTVLKVLYED